MAYGHFENLNRRTAADKVWHDKIFHIAEIQNMMDINVDLLQWSISLFNKKLILVMLKK